MTHADKTQETPKKSVTNEVSQRHNRVNSTFQFVDNRPEAIAQRKLQEIANNSPQIKQIAQLQVTANNYSAKQNNPVQQKKSPELNLRKNNTGLPDNLKTGIENLSGYSMDDVKVHYNSNKPVQLHAHAYTQGTDIHVASGQEKHLPHEAWHVVQQKQGRVKPTIQMKGNVNVNDDTGLEKEADVMGTKALALITTSSKSRTANVNASTVGGSFSSVKQLKESATLVAGGLNMIGETHSDYSGKEERGVEANKIRSLLGGGNKYFTESMLKTKPQNLDYSDPIYLRLEQVFGFILESGGNILQQLRKIDPSVLAEKTLATKAVNEKIALIVLDLAPYIASDTFTVETILDTVESKHLTKAELQRLGSVEAWNLSELDPEDKYEDNFYNVQDRVEEMAESIVEEASSASEEVVVDPFIMANKLVYVDFFNFYDMYKGRLPLTLKLYYDLKKKEHVTTKLSRFNFDIDAIKPLLAEWDKIESLRGIVTDVMTKHRIDLIPDIVKTVICKIEKLIQLIREGQLGSGSEDHTNVIRRHRSIEMDQAAEELKSENIAWKVGNLHVEDIKFMESLGTANTGYTYITKENFKAQIEHVSELDASIDPSEKVGADYLEADKTTKGIISTVDEDLDR
ncbi:MAG: DUF4157 domain-containing protein [Bacteroidales bacterium]|jgi:hypothetical protein|nr:DUF4157 domain-containing protein [Bacteroidales bacterium]